jgi:hypothetical protein
MSIIMLLSFPERKDWNSSLNLHALDCGKIFTHKEYYLSMNMWSENDGYTGVSAYL